MSLVLGARPEVNHQHKWNATGVEPSPKLQDEGIQARCSVEVPLKLLQHLWEGGRVGYRLHRYKVAR